MLSSYKLTLIIFLLNVVYSSAALSRTNFNEAYEAAQSGDYKRAITLWMPLAKQGDASAQYTLGWMFESGQGVPQDYQQAILWYTEAGNQGDVAAQYVLGTMYDKGTGVPKDPQQAVYWFTKAANQGDAVAQFQLASHYQKNNTLQQDYKLSLSWFKKAAEQGHLTSQINLGKIYQSGRGVNQDYKKAIEWYKKASKQNNALGQYHLAHMYEYGRGVNKDFKQAKSLYMQSANNQYAHSAYKVAEFYELGKGIDVNFQNAAQWYRVAANKGNSGAQFKLGALYQDGKGVKKNIRSAIDWYTQAANQNHSQAHYNLAVIYLEGVASNQKSQLIKINYKKAFYHLQTSSQFDYLEAHAQLAYLYENGLGTEPDLTTAIALYKKSPQPSAMVRFKLLSKQLQCYNTATTELFNVNIACTNREVLREKIKENKIVAISENINQWSDVYFTGAVIHGSSKLKVTYTREDLFVSARYTFVGRNNPNVINKVKNKLIEKYGQPNTQNGKEKQGPLSFEWLMPDGINLIVSRGWPDTTTYVLYFSREKKSILEHQQKQSSDKTYMSQRKNINNSNGPSLF